MFQPFMKLDFTIFDPNVEQRSAINSIAAFCESHHKPTFALNELLDQSVAPEQRKTISDWLRPSRRAVVLDYLLLLQENGTWRCDQLIPESVPYHALRLMPAFSKKFGDHKVPSDNKEFLSLVYSGRARILGKPATAVTPQLFAFIKERLARCGLETLSADLSSISEIWDVFDDYEFQQLMGRQP